MNANVAVESVLSSAGKLVIVVTGGPSTVHVYDAARLVDVAGRVDGAHAQGVLTGGQLEQLQRVVAGAEAREVEVALERRADLGGGEDERGVRVAGQRQRLVDDRRVGSGRVRLDPGRPR